jgi:transposase-like protein
VFTDATKFKIVIEAIKGQRQISEIASDYEVHPNQISNWKKQFLEKGATMFSTKKDSQVVELENNEEDLFKKIGKQQIELDFLKKSLKKWELWKEEK